jgi:hypothetical protein
MEVTKWLKPSDSALRIGDGASVQAVTRVNAEQVSKRMMRRSTRRPFRGRLTRLGDAQPLRRGSGGSMVHKESVRNTGRPRGVVRDDQPDAREGQAGRPEVAERYAVPLKPGNAVGGNSSRQTQYAVRDLEIGQPINSEECSEAVLMRSPLAIGSASPRFRAPSMTAAT